VISHLLGVMIAREDAACWRMADADQVASPCVESQGVARVAGTFLKV
jgi:hypothetical protein